VQTGCGCCERAVGVGRSEGPRGCTRETVAVGQSGVGLGFAASILVWPPTPTPTLLYSGSYRARRIDITRLADPDVRQRYNSLLYQPQLRVPSRQQAIFQTNLLSFMQITSLKATCFQTGGSFFRQFSDSVSNVANCFVRANM